MVSFIAVGSSVCNPPFLFSTHPFYENTLYTEFYNTPFYYGLWNGVLNPRFEPYTASLVILLVLEVISPCLTMSIKQNSYNQHFVNSYNVWMFWNVCGISPPPPHGYIIHGKHISTDRSRYFINHQNPPFLFLDPPFIQNHPLYQWNPVAHPFTIFLEFLNPPFLKHGLPTMCF